MIDPQNQWAIQIDILNKCIRNCSNCTRLIGHVKEPFYMSLETFEKAVTALARFPMDSPPSEIPVANKVVGLIGGEVLLHPQFAEIVAIMMRVIPERKYRGLWTGMVWENTKYAELIREAFGYINNNKHDTECLHSPVLTAIDDVITDKAARDKLINRCWLQRMWSGTITPKGFFFCEVAGAMDMLFDGPGGLAVEPGCWRRPISDFQDQIDRWCPGCGVAMNLRGRQDCEQLDDMSYSNLARLHDSPRVVAGDYKLYDVAAIVTTDKPWEYLQ